MLRGCYIAVVTREQLNHQAWPPHMEACGDDPLPKHVAIAFKARKNNIVIMVVNYLLTYYSTF